MERFDLTKSTIAIRWVGDDEGGIAYELTIIPIDRHDNYLGPGHKIEAVVVPPGNKWTGRRTQLTDNLDGSYTGRVRLTPEEVDAGASIRVDIGGRSIAVTPLPPPRRFFISAYAGVTVPVADFSNLFDPGLLAEVGVGYDIGRHLALEAIFGRYAFDPSYEIYGGTAYAKGYAPINGVRLFGAAGIGLYKPENIDVAFGVSPAIGLDWRITPSVRGEVAASFFHIFSQGDDIDFFGIKVGVNLVP